MDYLYNSFGDFNLTQSIIFGIVMFLIYTYGRYIGGKKVIRCIDHFYDINPNTKHKTELFNFLKINLR